MSEIQDKINQILSNPEALRQVQSLGEQLGLSAPEPPKPAPTAIERSGNSFMNDDMLKMMTRLAPVMKNFNQDDETTALLNALKPFLGSDKIQRLEQAQRMMRLIKMIPLIKESGLFI